MATFQDIEIRDPAARASDAVEELRDMQGEKMVLNMGPSHPATHGVLRIVLELDGEIITKAEPDVGYLHRGDEKIAENMTYTQFIPYTTGWIILRHWPTTLPMRSRWKNCLALKRICRRAANTSA